MDLSYNETQGMLRETLARFLADTYDFESRKKMLSRPEGRDPGIWKAIATELGLTCAPFAEEHGGMGGGAIENMIMMEEFGKVIAIEPWRAQARWRRAGRSDHPRDHQRRLRNRLCLCRTAGPLQPGGHRHFGQGRWRRLCPQWPQERGLCRALVHPPARHRPHWRRPP